MLFVLLLYNVHLSLSSPTLSHTKNSLHSLAASSQGLGRKGAGIRTEFYKALADVERSILLAEASFTRLSSAKALRTYLPLQKVLISAGKSGNFRFGREIFGFGRFLQDKMSHSMSRRRHKRNADSFIDYIKDKLGEQTFNQFFSIESGTSLTFVLDTTGSMQRDINQVQSIVRYLSSAADEEDFSIHNYILSPFNDPMYGPAEQYMDKGPFLSALEGLRANGGGDCPELILKGLVGGLEQTMSFSPVFVFTDAEAKDVAEFDNVISMAKMFYTPIFFFVTTSEDCPHNVTLFETIADHTKGQVLKMGKDEVGRLGRFVKSYGIGTAILASGTDSTSSGLSKRSTDRNHLVNFHCDETVGELMVSVTFDSLISTSYLVSPTGTTHHPSFISSESNMRLYEILDPERGQWTLKAVIERDAEFSYSVASVSQTNIDFDYFFLARGRGSYKPVDHTIPGTNVELKLNLLGDPMLIQADRLTLYLTDMLGNVISTVQTLVQSADDDSQYDGVFAVPEHQFKLRLFGQTLSGDIFTRISQKTETPSFGALEPLSGDLTKRIVKPGSSGSFYFRFSNYGKPAKFRVYFTNPNRILTSRAPKSLGRVLTKRNKMVKLGYRVPKDLPEGTEYRIPITVADDSGRSKIRYVHTFIVSRYNVK